MSQVELNACTLSSVKSHLWNNYWSLPLGSHVYRECCRGAQLERRDSWIHFLPFPCLLFVRVVRFACLSSRNFRIISRNQEHIYVSWCNGSWWCRFSFVVLCICIEVKYTELRICHYKFIVNVLCMMLYNCLYYVFPKPSVHPNRH